MYKTSNDRVSWAKVLFGTIFLFGPLVTLAVALFCLPISWIVHWLWHFDFFGIVFPYIIPCCFVAALLWARTEL